MEKRFLREHSAQGLVTDIFMSLLEIFDHVHVVYYVLYSCKPFSARISLYIKYTPMFALN